MSTDIIPIKSDRLTLFRFPSKESSDTFARDVYTGLSSHPKKLLPKYFYDELGSHLFEAICYLPEYYVTRDESEIFREHVKEIIDEITLPVQSHVRLIELGSGSAIKTQHIIGSLLQREIKLNYVPIDVSISSLEHSSNELLRTYPDLRITAYATDYSSALKTLAHADTHEHRDDQQTIVLFLGSSIGNLDPNESRVLLKEVRELLRPQDALLLGADLKKSLAVLLPAYNDALGVTAAFNLNLLVRINRELSGEFDATKFEHRAIYNEADGRIEMHLFSRETQVIRIGAIDSEFTFGLGESIHTENSYKFDMEKLSELAVGTGFQLNRTWVDANRRFSLNFFEAI
jgi:L-histidine N-alpha-methyltransferase